MHEWMNDYHCKVFNFTTVHYIKKAGISIGFTINKWQDLNDKQLSIGQILCYTMHVSTVSLFSSKRILWCNIRNTYKNSYMIWHPGPI